MTLIRLIPGSLCSEAGNVEIWWSRLVAYGDGGRVRVLRAGSEAPVMLGGANLQLLPLSTGMRVAAGDRGSGPIVEVDLDSEGLRRVRVELAGDSVWLDEAEIEPVSPEATSPLAILRSGSWRHPAGYLSRVGLRERLGVAAQDTSGLPSMLGARIRPLGHQIYAAQRVLTDRVPRFILADEVGLGKTIEAGLVIQALASARPDLRVLVLAPGSMTSQWWMELYLRFGGVSYQQLAQGVWRSSDQEALDASPRIIASFNSLLRSKKRREALLNMSWDVLVIDEAHQHPPGQPLYPTLRLLAERADGVLVLSATPSKRELVGLSGLLGLVSPDVYKSGDTEILARRIKAKREIWEALEATQSMIAGFGFGVGVGDETDAGVFTAEDARAVADDWQPVLEHDSRIASLASELAASEGEPALAIASRLCAYVQEFHRVDARLVRTRRKTLSRFTQEFPARELAQLWEYEASLEERDAVAHLELYPGGDAARAALLAMTSRGPGAVGAFLDWRAQAPASDNTSEGLLLALASDPAPTEETALLSTIGKTSVMTDAERHWLEDATSYVVQWARAVDAAGGTSRELHIAEHTDALLADGVQRVLVFVQSADAAESLCQCIAKRLGPRQVVRFHSDLDRTEREQAILDFQRTPTVRVLVSDELGGEGRNLQVADVVVHGDTPLAVSRIEQRIGRLDRIGRDSDRPVRSIVVLGPSAVERTLHRFHSEVFDVYRHSIGGLEFMLPALQRAVFDTVARGDDLAPLIDAATKDVTEYRSSADEEFELALDSSWPELERAHEESEIWEDMPDDALGRAIVHWLRTLGIRTDWNRSRSSVVSLKVDPERLEAPLRGFDEGDPWPAEATISRAVALEHESLQYIAPGHRLVDASLEALERTSVGRVAVFSRDLGAGTFRKVYVQASFVVAMDTELWEDGLSAGLQARGARYWPGKSVSRVVGLGRGLIDEPLPQRLGSHFSRRDGDAPLSSADLAELCGGDLERLLALVETTVDAFTQDIASGELAEIEDQAGILEEDLSQELQFFEAACTSPGEWGISPDEARREIESRISLVASIRGARVQLDGLALIIGGSQ